jgi:adenylosuccinate lyase
MARVIEGLQVNVQAVGRNLRAAGDLIYSQKLLLLLARKGLPRQQAYEKVQKAALESASSGTSFVDLLLADAHITQVLAQEEIRSACALDSYLTHVHTLLQRSLSKD